MLLRSGFGLFGNPDKPTVNDKPGSSTAVAIADAGEVVAPLGVVAIIRISGWSIPLIKDGVDYCRVDAADLFAAYPAVNKAAKKQAGAGGDPDGVWHGGNILVGQSGPVAPLNFMRRS